MELTEVVTQLKEAKSGSRPLDVQIALAVGWRRKVEPANNQKAGEKPKTLWLLPNTNEVGRVPNYTTDLHHAFELANQLLPAHVGACSWEPGMGSAKIGLENEPVQASSPMLAVCIAALELYVRLR